VTIVHPAGQAGFSTAPAQSEKDHIMKITVATAIVTFALVAPTLAMPIASPVPTAHSDQAVVQVYYNHYRGGHGHHYGWGRGRHRGWGNSYHHRY
jgi:hypothetical protein